MLRAGWWQEMLQDFKHLLKYMVMVVTLLCSALSDTPSPEVSTSGELYDSLLQEEHPLYPGTTCAQCMIYFGCDWPGVGGMRTR